MSARVALRAYLLLWAPLLAAAATAATLPGAPAHLRDAFNFALTPQPPELSDAASIFTTNTRVAALALLGAIAAAQGVLWRTLLDALLATVLTLNMLLIGLALGAYGTQLVPWLVHLPLELAGLAVPLGAYLSHRRGPLPPTPLLTAAALAVALLAIGALVETYLTPHP